MSLVQFPFPKLSEIDKAKLNRDKALLECMEKHHAKEDFRQLKARTPDETKAEKESRHLEMRAFADDATDEERRAYDESFLPNRRYQPQPVLPREQMSLVQFPFPKLSEIDKAKLNRDKALLECMMHRL